VTTSRSTHDEPGLPESSADLRPDAVPPLADEALDPRDAAEAGDLPPTDPVEEKLAALAQEALAARDAHLRAEAELQNARRRHRRDLEDAERAGADRLLHPVIALVDDLDRALDAAVTAGTGESALAQGVALARQRLLDGLQAAGLETTAPVGAPFDPHTQEALVHAPSATVPAGHVVQVIARGFARGERVVRAARVVVSSGPAGEGGA